eukprot:m.93824 g.93824  ORF g.93824 m.93824 type:complete len:106 (+) comp13010_c1_seq13:1173-1490(+)
MVHLGFYEAYVAVQQELMSYVAQHVTAYPDYRVLIAGHSLGASLGALCALDLRLQYSQLQISLYTFGMPRVGNPVCPIIMNQFLKSSSIFWPFCCSEQARGGKRT